MRIATVTLNPAIDQTVSTDDFQIGTVNRGRAMRFDAGGKGVNVASFLADYGMDVAVTGFLGVENASIFERHFAHKKISDHFVRIPGETRVNVKITDEHNQETTDINMPGQAADENKIHDLLDQVDFLAETCDWFILAGNLQPGLAPDFYGQIIKILKWKNKQIVLDTSGDALFAGLLAGPSIIKPNVDELSQLTRETLSGLPAIHKAARSLLNADTRLVVISMGGDGALFVERNQAFVAQPPVVAVKSTVGAGDAMVAGLVAGLTQNLELTECARLATAFSLSAITRLGHGLPEAGVIEMYKQQVTITPFVIEQP